MYCWFSRCTILVIFNICVRIIWCQFAVGRFSDWEAVWWWCNGFFFSCYPIIDFQLTCTALNTSAGRKITLSLRKREEILIVPGIFSVWREFGFVLSSEGSHFVNHHDPSQEKARISQASVSWREYREWLISEAAIAFWWRSWCYKRNGGGVPSKQVICADSKQR